MQFIRPPSHRAGWRSMKSGSGGANKIPDSHIATFTILIQF